MKEWSDDDLRATVEAYLAMLALETEDLPYSKTDFRRGLLAGPLKQRTNSGIEYRMRNISAVLEEHGRPRLRGYAPAKNVGSAVSHRLWAIIRETTAKTVGTVPIDDRAPGLLPVTGAASRRPPMIYFNIGWMYNYAGFDPSDPTLGGHAWLDSHDHGAEAFNFTVAADGTFRGYRPPGDRERINIDRLGAASSDAFVDGATVVWMAREPAGKRTVIVGWYRNARVFRDALPDELAPDREQRVYSAQSRVGNGRLLAVEAREFQIESGQAAPGEGFGRNPTWYGAKSVDERVWAYIRSFEHSGKPSDRRSGRKPPKNYNPELRREVEQAAVAHATTYYKSIYGQDCPVISVETSAKGWDLEVGYGPEPLLVEVKGLLNSNLVCELTPNEYEKMRSRSYRKRYVIFVVTNALAKAPAAPIPTVFRHAGKNRWQTADGRMLKIREQTGAILSCS